MCEELKNLESQHLKSVREVEALRKAGESGQHVTDGYAKARALASEVKRYHLLEAEKVLHLLQAFYQERVVPEERHLVFQLCTLSRSRLQSQEAEFQEIAPREKKQQKLQEY